MKDGYRLSGLSSSVGDRCHWLRWEGHQKGRVVGYDQDHSPPVVIKLHSMCTYSRVPNPSHHFTYPGIFFKIYSPEKYAHRFCFSRSDIGSENL